MVTKRQRESYSPENAVFAVMLQTNMSDKSNNAVQISDFDGDVVKGMFEYLYTGETESMTQRAPKLLRIVEKYNLPGLKEDSEYAVNVSTWTMLQRCSILPICTMLCF